MRTFAENALNLLKTRNAVNNRVFCSENSIKFNIKFRKRVPHRFWRFYVHSTWHSPKFVLHAKNLWNTEGIQDFRADSIHVNKRKIQLKSSSALMLYYWQNNRHEKPRKISIIRIGISRFAWTTPRPSSMLNCSQESQESVDNKVD